MPVEKKNISVLRPRSTTNWAVVGIVGIILLVALLLILNYFHIFPLSRAYPEQFGWLPHQSLAGEREQTVFDTSSFIPAEKTKGKFIIACPLPQEFCQNARVVSDGAEFYGLGFFVPQGTPIYAILEGSISDQPRPEGRSPDQPLLYLKDSEGREVVYSYYGTVSVPLASGILENGKEVGVVGLGTFPNVPPFNGLNFVFGIKASDGRYIEMTPSDFEEYFK